MGIFGSPHSTGFGAPTKFLSVLDVRPTGTTTKTKQWNVWLQAAPGMGDAWFGIYVDDALSQPVYLNEGMLMGPYRIVRPVLATGDIFLSIQRHGHNAWVDMTKESRTEDEMSNPRTVTVNWAWPQLPFRNAGDGGQTSAWSSWGIERASVLKDPNYPNRGILQNDLTISGFSGYVDLYAGAIDFAKGSGPVPGTLSWTGTSGASGAMQMAAGITGFSGASYCIEWPAYARIRKGSSWGTTPQAAAVPFNDSDAAKWTDPARLTAGTWYYKWAPVSDTGVEGSGSSGSFVINAPPNPPAVTGFSGNAGYFKLYTNAPAGISLNGYWQRPGDPYLDTSIPAFSSATSVIGFSGFSGYPGTVTCLVRGTSGGIENINGKNYDYEFDVSGNRIVPRPNPATITGLEVSGASGLYVTAGYDPSNEDGAPTQIFLYVRPESSSAYSSAAASGALGTLQSDGLRRGTVLAWIPAGTNYCMVKAATADGTTSQYPSNDRMAYASPVLFPPLVGSGTASRG